MVFVAVSHDVRYFRQHLFYWPQKNSVYFISILFEPFSYSICRPLIIVSSSKVRYFEFYYVFYVRSASIFDVFPGAHLLIRWYLVPAILMELVSLHIQNHPSPVCIGASPSSSLISFSIVSHYWSQQNSCIWHTLVYHIPHGVCLNYLGVRQFVIPYAPLEFICISYNIVSILFITATLNSKYFLGFLQILSI